MAGSTSVGRGRVFISYRRDDSAYPAGWLYDRLCAHLGSEQVFKDVDSIDPGDDFVWVLENAVGSCQVLLALIGDRWLDITDETGQRRLDNPDDFVRIEIEAALRRGVRVVPLLVGRAPMPRSEQLPDSLQGLVRRHAIQLSPNRFESDLARLLPVIDKTLAAIRDGPAEAPTGASGDTQATKTVVADDVATTAPEIDAETVVAQGAATTAPETDTTTKTEPAGTDQSAQATDPGADATYASTAAQPSSPASTPQAELAHQHEPALKSDDVAANLAGNSAPGADADVRETAEHAPIARSHTETGVRGTTSPSRRLISGHPARRRRR